MKTTLSAIFLALLAALFIAGPHSTASAAALQPTSTQTQLGSAVSSVEFQGTIQSIRGNVIRVAGRTVTITRGTVVEGKLKVGAHARVEGYYRGKVLYALEVVVGLNP